MSDYKYTLIPGKFPEFFAKIRSVGKPSKVDPDYLKTITFGASSYRAMIPLLKELGFLDSSGAPTKAWVDYRGSENRRVLGEAVKGAYRELFEMYEDAHTRSDDELSSFFRAHTNAGDDIVKRIVSTFKALCSLSDMGAASSLGAEEPPKPEATSGESAKDSNGANQSVRSSPSQAAPSVHIDIQIHISAESSPEQIDQIFSSMAKHLYKIDK